jgi:hypothetical protein
VSNATIESAASLKIVDFHNHHVPARFELTAATMAPANQRGRWEAIARRVSDEELLLRDIATARSARGSSTSLPL